MDGIGRFGMWSLAGGVGLLALIAALALLNRRDQHVGLGEEIQYDDFAFAVVATKRVSTLGPAPSTTTARGSFLVVTLRVANHAQRVDYHFDRAIVRLADSDSRDYRFSPEGQAALEAAEWKSDPCAAAIPAGASCVTQLVFDVPPDAHDLRLEISMGGNALFDFLDKVGWGEKFIRLE